MPDTWTDIALHDWTVEDREVRRHVSRRGRQHAFETIDPARTALVVIDMVPFFVHESAYCRGIVPNINALAEALRLAGGVVAWVVPGYRAPSARDREFFGEVVADTYARSGGDGEPADRLWSGLAIDDEDLVVEKTARSAFFPGSSTLANLLAERGIDTVVVTGTVANVCVEASVRDASTLLSSGPGGRRLCRRARPGPQCHAARRLPVVRRRAAHLRGPRPDQRDGVTHSQRAPATEQSGWAAPGMPAVLLGNATRPEHLWTGLRRWRRNDRARPTTTERSSPCP